MTLTIEQRKDALISIRGCFMNFSKQSKYVKDDTEICFEAIKLKFFQFSHISDRLKSDKCFVLSLIRNSNEIYQYLPEELCDDEDIFKIVFLSSKHNEDMFNFISPRIRNDKNLMSKYLNRNPDIVTIYPYLSEELQCKPKNINKLLQKPGNYIFLPENIMKRHSIIALILSKSDRILFESILETTKSSNMFKIWALSDDFKKWKKSNESYNIYMFKRYTRIVGRLSLIFGRYSADWYHIDNINNKELNQAKKRFKKNKLIK